MTQAAEQSRLVLQEFCIQTGIGFLLMLGLSVAFAQSWLDFTQAVTRVFTFYSLIGCVRAARRRQVPWAGSLTLWDQAMAYSGCAFLMHAISLMQG